jgi:hypothetical protein
MTKNAGRPAAALLAAVLSVTALPAAGADSAGTAPSPVLFILGARFSAALPMGSVLSDPATGSLLVDELLTLSLPLQLDVGVGLGGHWFVGGYVQYGWSVFQIGQCQVGESCTITDLRLGVQALYSVHEKGDTPWFGLGTGWEWMFTSYSSPTFATTLDVSGWEFLNLQAGYDVVVAPGWKVGPWVSGSVGEFSRASMGRSGQTQNSDIPNKALHGWLQLGVKGTFGF